MVCLDCMWFRLPSLATTVCLISASDTYIQPVMPIEVEDFTGAPINGGKKT